MPDVLAQVQINTGANLSYIEQSQVKQGDSSSTHLSSCELSAKSLMTLLPAVLEPFFFMFLTLAALTLFCTNLFISRANNEEKHALQESEDTYNFVIRINTQRIGIRLCNLFWRKQCVFN